MLNTHASNEQVHNDDYDDLQGRSVCAEIDYQNPTAARKLVGKRKRVNKDLFVTNNKAKARAHVSL